MQKNTLILYTYGLRGQVSLLPPLFTFLRDLRKGRSADTTLLLDLGDACAPDVWHCAATQGRSMLIVMDAMGYHAANVSGYLSDDGRTKLDGTVSMALVDGAQPFVAQNELKIWLVPAEKTELTSEGTLRLAQVEAGQVGVVRVSDEPKLIAHEVVTMPPKTPPDATIAGVVDFVLSEAKYYGRKKGES